MRMEISLYNFLRGPSSKGSSIYNSLPVFLNVLSKMNRMQYMTILALSNSASNVDNKSIVRVPNIIH